MLVDPIALDAEESGYVSGIHEPRRRFDLQPADELRHAVGNLLDVVGFETHVGEATDRFGVFLA